MINKDIAIVGMSCFAPDAKNMKEYWSNLLNGVDSIRDMPADRIDPRYFDTKTTGVDRFYCRKGGCIPDMLFDPMEFSILPISVEGMDSAHLTALKTARSALEDAGVFKKNISLDKCALVIGKGAYMGPAIWRAADIVHVGEQIADVVRTVLPDLSEDEVDKIKKQYQDSRGRYQADSIPGIIPNLVASLISNKLDMHGPSYVVDAACASSFIALEHCVRELQSGRSDIALAGGIHLDQNAIFWSIFSQLGALSRKQSITPFSEDADGLLIGEGGGFVVLKTLDKALADSDRIYAVIKSVGVASDGSGASVMAPTIKGQKIAIENAWEQVSMNKSKIGYIEAHGTGTIVGDKVELQTLSEFFPKSDSSDEILLGSVKSNIGHAMPAAGILSLIKTTLALYTRQIPPMLHCERPLKELQDTRFRLADKLQEWDENKYPLVAGINAFGFGGINSHVILEAHGEKQTFNESSDPFKDKVVALTAPSKEALINALRNGENLGSLEGNHRVVIFNPTQERIERAIKFIEKDIVWKGRQDIWYTNTPLLKDGGKVAFMYPGYDLDANPEIESLFNYFKFSLPQVNSDASELVDNFHRLRRISLAMSTALGELNIKSDLNLGHSLGEWLATEAAGMATAESILNLINSIDDKEVNINGIYFVAVGAGKERVSNFLDTIPDLYLSNDNCPNQALLCGTTEAVKKLEEGLKKEQIMFQILPFQSGFHTPFIKDKIGELGESFKHLEILETKVPIWSANTLSPYPKDLQAIQELSVTHLLETVRFRELIEKLHKEENVRVFIQVGGGALVGFVDDILAKKQYSAIASGTNLRSSLDQLKRVVALLFIEGKDVNMTFLDVEKEDNVSVEKGIKIITNMHLQKKFPLLSQYTKAYKDTSASFDFGSLSLDLNNPLVAAINENMKEISQIHMEMAQLIQKKSNRRVMPATPITEPIINKQPAAVVGYKNDTIVNLKIGMTFEENVNISLTTHPYLMGHSLVKQPPHWKCPDDLNPVIPMTMNIELLAEAANRQAPEKKVVSLRDVSVFQWMEVHQPFIQKMVGSWKTEDTIVLGIKNFSTGEVTLKDSYPEVDPTYVNDIDLGENIRALPTRENVYEEYMFHGVEYQGIEKVTNVTDKGLRAYIKTPIGKGALLDNMGQAYGLYLQLTLDVNYITFPVKIPELVFYQDMHDQEGEFECICISKTITDDFVTGDIILKRDGKLWCIARDWQSRRFEFDSKLWKMTMNPGRNLMASKIADGVFYYHNEGFNGAVWGFLTKRYLNKPEKDHLETMLLNKRKDFLISRIALKDNLRSYVQNKTGKTTFPIEFSVEYDANGKPSPHGIEEIEGVEISIAHKGTESVSIVSTKPVGIDIESITERTEDFMNIAFTDGELELLKDKDAAEWSTRFWVAKEAYGKMLGLGLQGNPKRYEINKIIDDETLLIENQEVRIIKRNNHIIGWTL